MAFENVPEQRAGRLARPVGVDHINTCLGNLQMAKVRSQHRIELSRQDLESRFLKQAVELVENHRMWREQANIQKLRIRFFSGFCHGFDFQASGVWEQEQGGWWRRLRTRHGVPAHLAWKPNRSQDRTAA